MKTPQDGCGREVSTRPNARGPGVLPACTPALAPKEVPPPVRNVLYAGRARRTGELGVRLYPPQGCRVGGGGSPLWSPPAGARQPHPRAHAFCVPAAPDSRCAPQARTWRGNSPRKPANCLNRESSPLAKLAVRNTIPRAKDKGGTSFSA